MKTVMKYGKQVLKAFKNGEQKKLKGMAKDSIQETFIRSKKTNFSFASLTYMLYKIVSKPRLLKYEDRVREIESKIEKLVRESKTIGEEEALSLFQSIEEKIKELDNQDPRYVLGLVFKGKLKTAATLYAQGMSLDSVSNLAEIEKQEILDYAGHSMMFDRVEEKTSIETRLKWARELVD